MTATEKYKRAEALFNDRTKRELADMVVHRESDLEDARAENDELWALNEHMGLKYMAAMGELGEENERLEADNAMLRELCAGLLNGYECGNGELCDGCSWNGLEGDCAARTKARELGVEVDE